MTYHSRIRMDVAGETCPAIDRVIKATLLARKLADRYGSKCEDSDTTDKFGDIERELWGVEDDMEEIRKANASLRDALTEALRELDRVGTKEEA